MSMFKLVQRAALGVAAALICISSQAAIADSASVYLRPQAGSYVGGNLPLSGVTWTHGIDGVFMTQVEFSRVAHVYFTGDESWTFQFAAAQYSPIDNLVMPRALTVGFYDNATRYPFNSPTRPGMNVSGGGRGYNQLSGWFNVLEVEYSSNFEVTKLAVDFAEYGENLTQSGPALFGSLRLNSSIPITSSVPETSTLLQFCAGLALAAALRTRRREA
jgi:hypothetical protein